MPTPSEPPHAWVDEFPVAVTVCDAKGVITELNNAATQAFAEDGGRALVGRNLLDCHPEHARTVVNDLLSARRANTYTIQKDGRRKLILQSPWYRNGQFAGIVELSIELPASIPHFNRDATDAPPSP